MRCTVNRKELQELLKNLQLVAPKKHTLEVVTMALVTVSKGKLEASATDLETCLTGTIKARVSEPGSMCIPMTVIKLLNTLKDETIELFTEEANLINVKGKSSCTKFHTKPADDFPPIPTIGGKCKKVTIAGLTSHLNMVSYAVAKDDYARPALSGICLNPVRGGTDCIASDGFRLGLTKISGSSKLPTQIIIPYKTVGITTKLFSGKVEVQYPVTNESTLRLVIFQNAKYTMAFHPVQSSYPAYHHLFPKISKTNNVTFHKDELSNALKMFKSMQVNNNKVHFKSNCTGTDLVAHQSDDEEVSIKITSSGKINKAYDAKYLLAVLDRIDGKKVTFHNQKAMAPLTIQDQSSKHLVMPIATKSS